MSWDNRWCEWILFHVSFYTIVAISRKKEARSRKYALLLSNDLIDVDFEVLTPAALQTRRTGCSQILHFLNFDFEMLSSSTSYLKYQTGGGKGLVDLVNQLTLERCHSFWFYGSCRKRIPIRDSSMPKRILSQCGVSSKMFIGLIVPTMCSSVCWD